MSAVTKQEIVAMIEGLIESDACMGSISDKQAITALELVNRIKQHGIAPPDGMVLVRKDLVEFLRGSESIDGVWFGDKHSSHVGTYWWRNLLPAAPEVSNER